MVHSDPGRSTEETALLPNQHDAERSQIIQTPLQNSSLSLHRVLPVALLVALAMSSSAATAYYAYATLLCKDPRHCKGDETSKYAQFIAVTTSVSNLLGMIVLGPLQAMMKNNYIYVLVLWQITRSMSPIMLLSGVSANNIYLALSSRVFDGIASDNLLHFILNSIYALSAEPETTSSLIGYSLALYMVGISISPFVGGLFKNFSISFVVAIGIFAITIAYTSIRIRHTTSRKEMTHTNQNIYATNNGSRSSRRSMLRTFVAPLQAFRHRPASLFCGLSMFTYNMVQSYTFTALLVHTSVRFGFDGRQNGLVLTIAHSVAALYIFISLYAVPRILSRVAGQGHLQDSTQITNNWPTQDGIRAVLSLCLQTISLLVVGLATQTWHIYAATVLLALGLPTPSFMKAYVVHLFKGHQKREALAALTALEVIGDVLGPITLGTWQSYSAMAGGVFFGAAGMVTVSLAFFLAALVMVKREGKSTTTVQSSVSSDD